MSVEDEIKQQLADHDVVLYMKGAREFPRCGFSATVIHILQKCAVAFHTVNVLEDDKIRIAIKEYANWPTIPQLYIRGEFVGGCDIVAEMYESGELQGMLAGADEVGE